MSEFLQMGGYAGYVWGSYAAMAVVFAWNLIVPALRWRDLRRDLRGTAAEPK